jgi:hypothetical protein
MGITVSEANFIDNLDFPISTCFDFYEICSGADECLRSRLREQVLLLFAANSRWGTHQFGHPSSLI